jgi:basic amino acid/polyamine antiporter, APA family
VNRSLGTGAVIITLVGYVIGASIFILPGSLAGSAGPGVVVSYLLAAIIAAFSCLAAGQLGTVFPRIGAGYVAVSRLLSPAAGVVGIWLMLAVYVLAIVLIALGFAQYWEALLPSPGTGWMAAAAIAAFTLANMANLSLLVRLQGLLVLGFMLALVAVTGGGLANMDAANLQPVFPAGWHPVIYATVPAFFSYGGFMAVMEMAGEIRQPARTIPRALALSFLLVVATYIGLSLALVGNIPWRELAATPAPVKVVAEQLFGTASGVLVGIAVLGAAATSINALILVASRDLYALAKDGYLPRSLVRGQSMTPCVALVGALALVSLGFGETVTAYAVWVSSFTLIFQVLVGAALLQVPTRAAAGYAASPFKLGAVGLRFAGWGLIAVSAFFLLYVLQNSLAQFAWGGAYLLLGLLLYRRRRGEAASEETGLEGGSDVPEC